MIKLVNKDETGNERVRDYSPEYRTGPISDFVMQSKIVGSGIRGVKNLMKAASGMSVDDLVYSPPMPNVTIPSDMRGAPQQNDGWMHIYEIKTDEGRKPKLSFGKTEHITPSVYKTELTGENTYNVYVMVQTKPGLSEELLEVKIDDVPVGVERDESFNGALPKSPTLSQNYPNPFNPSTRAEYFLPERSDVNISVYDIQGKLVQTIFNGEMNRGKYRVEWDGKDSHGSDVASGIYFLGMNASGRMITKRMVKQK